MTIEERVEFLHHSIESHDRQLGDLTDKLANLTTRFDGLGGMMAQVLEIMKTLAETVKDHERRINGIEGKG
jgi:hypothetical protein